jgi:hypothetical protein
MLKFIFNPEFKDYISLIALIISIIAFTITIYERKLRLSLSLSEFGGYNVIDIYNLTSRKVTISYFELYSCRHRFFLFKRTYANTWYNDGQHPKNLISAYESISIPFTDEYEINNFVAAALGERIYMKLQINGRKYKTVRLR